MRKVCNPIVAALFLVAAFVITGGPASAEVSKRDGWIVTPTPHAYGDVIKRVNAAAKANKIGIVTRASATVGAKKVLKKEIPGNMVVGLYHPRFAVRMLDASIAAGIEAPIRVYITENKDGTSTLSYRTPTHVFAPYMDEGGAKLKGLADELDGLFAKIVAEAAAK